MDIIQLYISYKSALTIHMVTHGDTYWKDHINAACVKSISEEKVLSQKLESSGIVIYVRYSGSCQRKLRHVPQYLT